MIGPLFLSVLQVPLEQLPTYARGQHLGGIDLGIMKRVKAELMFVHRDAAAAHGLDDAWLAREGRTL
jgi:hypothetical protein